MSSFWKWPQSGAIRNAKHCGAEDCLSSQRNFAINFHKNIHNHWSVLKRSLILIAWLSRFNSSNLTAWFDHAMCLLLLPSVQWMQAPASRLQLLLPPIIRFPSLDKFDLHYYTIIGLLALKRAPISRKLSKEKWSTSRRHRSSTWKCTNEQIVGQTTLWSIEA